MSHQGVTLGPAVMGELMARFVPAEAAGVWLMGSRARGAAGPFSDVDWVRVAADEAGLPGDGSYLLEGRLVVVATLTPQAIEAIFDDPCKACDYVMGLRTGQIMLDRDGTLARVQRRARDFVWGAAMQARANAWATAELVDWIEEVHKGLEGLRRGDVGRLLTARFGLSWGLSQVVKVQRGVLLSSDNGHWDEVNRAVGETSAWVRLRHAAFGVETADGPPLPLAEQVRAGLRLFAETVALLGPSLVEPGATLVRATAARMEEELARLAHG